VAAALGAKRLLLVLDNCEHVIEAAARMAEAVLRAAPHARVVATSREPLRAPGEYVYRVPSLEVPSEDTDDREELLQTIEQTVLCRLAVFAGGFTLEAASAVVTADDLDKPEAVDIVTNLAAKSLIVVEIADADAQYRLLETTRVYALEKLADSGELDQVARRHARHYQVVFERAEAEWDRPTLEWLAVYGPHIDNVRTAVDWAFSPSGDGSIGVALTTSALPLWFHQSLLVECRSRVERALASLAERPERDRRREMQLRTALLVALMETRGTTPDTIAAWTTVLHIAEGLADTEYQLAALWGLWLVHITRGEARTARVLVDRFCGLATDPVDRLRGERMMGASLHYLGDQAKARQILEGILSPHVAPAPQSRAVPFQYGRPNARLILSRILWLQGFPDQGLRLAEENVEDARAIDLAVGVCYALEIASLISIWSSDLVATERYVTALLDYSARHALAAWHRPARCYDGVRLIKRGEVGEGLELLRTALDELRGTSFVPYYPVMLGALARGLTEEGYVAQALATIDEALAKCERDEERWWFAELLRIKAEVMLSAEGADTAAAAEAHLQDALSWTRRQGALSLELRSATDLARLWHQQGRTAPARDLLAPIYARFTEGFATADLQAAKALLGSLGVT
jgi:predicted ATPase